jgi:hypothetical protein
MMTDRILSHSSFSHIVDVPIERVDISDWLFNLPEAEYQRCCPPDHIAAGATSTDNGRRMSAFAAVAIDVENIDDHRQREFDVDSGVSLDWTNERTERFLQEHLNSLRDVVSEADANDPDRTKSSGQKLHVF